MVKIIAHRRKHGVRKDLRSWEWHPSLDELKEKSESAKQLPEIT